MPIDPSMAQDLARHMVEIYDRAEATMLKEISRQLGRDIGTSDWAERKIVQTRLMREKIERQVARLAGATPEVAEQIVQEAFTRGSHVAARELGAVGAAAQAPASSAQVAALASELAGLTQQTHLRITRVADDWYRRAVLGGIGPLITGVETRREGAQRVLNKLADSGITGFVDRRGRSWDMVSYAEMATRTVAGRAAIEGHQQRLQANGFDLAYVSDAPEECPICRPWEGKVLSLSGSDPKYPSMSDATAGGLFHANCRHSTSLYVHNVTKPPKHTSDPDNARDREIQRRLERGVRQWKRRSEVALSDRERQYADAKVREWQGRLRVFVDGNNRKRLRYREQISRAR